MATATMPVWDLSVYFSSLDSSEFQTEFNKLSDKVDQFEEFAKSLPQDDLPFVTEYLKQMDEILERAKLLRSFVHSFVTTDSKNELAQSWSSKLEKLFIRVEGSNVVCLRRIGQVDVDGLVASDSDLNDYKYPLKRIQTIAQHMMSDAEEVLCSELSESGPNAWSLMYGTVTSQIEVEFRGETLPMSAVRALAYDPDQQTRKDAYECEKQGWDEWKTPLAASINAIKGWTVTTRKRRGWESALEASCFASAIDLDILDTMLGCARENFPAFRRYYRAKSKALGNPGALPWWDMFAPVGEAREWDYDLAMSFVEESFYAFDPRLGDLAKRSFEENWIDVAPRPGKRDGAFCMGTIDGESRILMNYKPSYGSVSTLAHELGHGYHNLCLRDRTPTQGVLPMTLAETASIFCELLVMDRALGVAEEKERSYILDAWLQRCSGVVVDITSRFEFERNLIRMREQRNVSVTELCDMMRESQASTYGDGMDPDTYHEFMWAAKLHYYSDRAYYNYPYMFGLLFAVGVYAVYKDSPDTFTDRYFELLSSTGQADARTLGLSMGFDIAEPEFWNRSLAFIAHHIDDFNKSVEV